ncbi:hypothetical protein ACPEIC_29185 [Stenotrophomonas sp. NPDC087984]
MKREEAFSRNWTPEQTGAFIDFVREDWLSGLPPVGRIKTSATSQERAAQAAIQWVRDRCKEAGLRILSAAKVSGHLPESGKRLHRLARFVIDSGEERGQDGGLRSP